MNPTSEIYTRLTQGESLPDIIQDIIERAEVPGSARARQAQLLLRAMTGYCHSRGLAWPISVDMEDAILISLYGDAAAQIISREKADASEYRRELEAEGLTIDDVLQAAFDEMRDFVNMARKSPPTKPESN